MITFYARSTDAGFPDRLQVRMSTNGSSTDVGITSASVGDFTNLLLDINPTLINGAFPNAWTQHVINLTGLSGIQSGRFAFRYFVTSGGPGGANSDYMGIDTLSITGPVAVPEPSQIALAGMILAIGVVARRFRRARA